MLVLAFTMLRCQFGSEPELKRIYKGKINYGEKVVSWFYFSTIGNITPDLLLLESKDNIDTICYVSNLKNITLKNDELTLFFQGTPRCYQDNVVIPTHVKKMKIKIDTIQ